MLRDFIKLMRPHQWYKNIVIFVALIFSHNLANLSLTMRTVYGFVLLCLMSSVVYIINDIKDADNDRKHPQKKKRPIPSGAVTKKQAGLFGLLLFVPTVYLSFMLDKMFFLGVALFFILGLAYSMKLKQIFILDVIVISTNFVLRAFVGGLLIQVPVHRAALGLYNSDDKRLLNIFITFSLSTLFISYAIYCIMKGEHLMMTTMPVALFLQPCLLRCSCYSDICILSRVARKYARARARFSRTDRC